MQISQALLRWLEIGSDAKIEVMRVFHLRSVGCPCELSGADFEERADLAVRIEAVLNVALHRTGSTLERA